MSDEYGIGPGIVIIKGATLGTDVILTGLLVETLEELAEMVMIETSSTGIGETGVFSNKIYEGRNVIGRAATSDIPIPGDSNMSSQHLLILYREAEGIFWAADQNSSNGTYINGTFVGDRVQLYTNDVIVLGATKMIFLAIPQ